MHISITNGIRCDEELYFCRMTIGKYHNLTIIQEAHVGFMLQNEAGEQAFLPYHSIHEDLNLVVGMSMAFFIYQNGEGDLMATMEEPTIELDEVAELTVKDVTEHGAFLDWGIPKDLFVPHREQSVPMEKDKRYLVKAVMDEKSNRIIATSRIERQLSKEAPPYTVGDMVELTIGHQTDLGINVIVDNAFMGLVFKNDIFKIIRPGDQMKGYVKKIRDDHKLDISLEPIGYASIEPNAQKILDLLKANDGQLPLHDKSSPDDIFLALEMSKKLFKKAIGSLYKQKIILIEPTGIRLIN